MDETMTTTKKIVTVDGTKVAETKKVNAKATAKVETKPSRSDLLALLDKHKYTGPRSYTATVLSGIVEWLDAKAPKDKIDGVPAGVVLAVHPDLRPVAAPKAKTLSKTYIAGRRDALVEVGSLMQGKDASVAALRSWLLAQVEAIAENGEATV